MDRIKYVVVVFKDKSIRTAIHLYKTSTSKTCNGAVNNERHCDKGRNARGIFTARHIRGGHKHLYGKIHFQRNEKDIYHIIVAIEYDRNRNAYIYLIHYGDGEKRHILHRRGDIIGEILFLVQKAAGAIAKLIGKLATLKLPYGEVRLIYKNYSATIGQVGNVAVNQKRLGRAGSRSWLGKCHVVRGILMKPVHHPHGGGEERAPIGRKNPTTPWGILYLKEETDKGLNIVLILLLIDVVNRKENENRISFFVFT
ncbi:50S ribosomal protein L2 chloroplastic [Bienertia sinuspersici]